MSLRTRLIARWFDVYLKTASNSTPVTAATIVAESQPGSNADGREQQPSHEACAARSSQAATCARPFVIRCIPGREAGRRLVPRPLRP